MESIIQELNIRKDCVVSEVSRGLYYSESQYKIINILEKCDINVLRNLRDLIEIDKNEFFDKVMERRMAYVNRVRRQIQKNNDKKNLLDNDGFIDISRNQDDTENLSCGITIMTQAIAQVNTIIENKQHIINVEISNKKSKKLGMVFLVVFVLVMCMVSYDKNSLHKISSFI